MASIKLLKKEVSSMATELAIACLLSKAEITETDIPKVNAILAEIYNFEYDFRLKAYQNTQHQESKQTRKYYNNLYDEIEAKANDIILKIKALN